MAGAPWDANTYDRTSEPQQSWASEVLARLAGIAVDATVLDVGCGTGRVTEALLALVPEGRVLAIDASADMEALACERLGEHAQEPASATFTAGWRGAPHIPMMSVRLPLDYVRLNASALRAPA